MSTRAALLVHGMGRTPLSMWRLARALRGAGLRVRVFGYTAAFESIDSMTHRLLRQLELIASDEYIAVGHSLGGLLLRRAIAAMPVEVRRPERLIMLGTPNHSPRLARRFGKQWWYRAINGDAGALLTDESRLQEIPLPDVPCTIVAGTRGLRGRWSPFGDEANDGIVAVSEAQLDGVDEWITMAVPHPLLSSHRAVCDLVVRRATHHTPFASSISLSPSTRNTVQSSIATAPNRR